MTCITGVTTIKDDPFNKRLVTEHNPLEACVCVHVPVAVHVPAGTVQSHQLSDNTYDSSMHMI